MALIETLLFIVEVGTVVAKFQFRTINAYEGTTLHLNCSSGYSSSEQEILNDTDVNIWAFEVKGRKRLVVAYNNMAEVFHCLVKFITAGFHGNFSRQVQCYQLQC